MPSETRTIYFKEAQERWELQASPAAFHVDGNGKCTDVVTVKLYSVKGGERTEVDGGGVTVHCDGEYLGNFTLPLTISPSKSLFNTEHYLFEAPAFANSPKLFTVSGVNGSNDLQIPVIYDGAPGQKGEKGAVLRGPQAWSDLPDGYSFYAGAEGDEIKDVVLYNGSYFSCIKSHTKSATNYPTSTEDTNNGYWKLGDPVEIVATKILLSQYALVKNLGVEAIEMKDDKNNVLFEAKGGKVTCKTGTFENVKISGELNGVTGTFNKLSALAKDKDGNIVEGAGIYMSGKVGEDGRVHISGNLDNMGLSFYGGNIFSTGAEFGVRGRLILFIRDDQYTLLRTALPNQSLPTYGFTGQEGTEAKPYQVPLFNLDAIFAVENKPVDVIVFNCTKSGLHYQLMADCIGKGVDIINANDKVNIYIASQKGWYYLVGGASMRGVYIGNGTAGQMNVNVINPKNDNVGAGWFFFGEKDFNW